MREWEDQESKWFRHAVASFRFIIRTVGAPTHLRKTLAISFLFGSWLVYFNIGGNLLRSPLSVTIDIEIFLNYLTPWILANLGLLSQGSGRPKAAHSQTCAHGEQAPLPQDPCR